MTNVNYSSVSHRFHTTSYNICHKRMWVDTIDMRKSITCLPLSCKLHVRYALSRHKYHVAQSAWKRFQSLKLYMLVHNRTFICCTIYTHSQYTIQCIWYNTICNVPNYTYAILVLCTIILFKKTLKHNKMKMKFPMPSP